MVELKSPAEHIDQGIWGAWEILGLEHNVVLDASVPKADGLRAEGRRLGATLLVDVHNWHNVAGEQLNTAGLDEEEMPGT